jgi:hypothetical protein
LLKALGPSANESITGIGIAEPPTPQRNRMASRYGRALPLRAAGQPTRIRPERPLWERRMENTSKDEEIRRKAYELWEEAGSPEGRAEEFWEQARASVGDGEETVTEDQSDTAPIGEAMTKT